MSIKECVKEPGAADITHHHYLITFKAYVLEGYVKDAGDSLVRTAGAKD
jgi:hypothetical protein